MKYAQRYRNQLTEKLGRIVNDIALLVTCGVYSSNTAQYKGVTVNGRSRFRFIGYTRGYSTFHVSQSLYNTLIDQLGYPALRLTRFRESGANPKLRLLRQIARILKIDEERLVFSGHQRSVFACPLAHNWREFLLGGVSKLDYYDDRYEDLVEAWRRRWLAKRWSSINVKEKVKSFQPEELSLLSEE